MAEREVFWNISSHWLFYVLAAFSVIVFFAGCFRHVFVWRSGRPGSGTVDLSVLIRALPSKVLGNVKIFRDDWFGGAMHLFVMWGFVVLFAGTVLSAVDDYVYIEAQHANGDATPDIEGYATKKVRFWVTHQGR